MCLLTVKVALASKRKTPAGMLGKRMEHVVKEANAGIDADSLRFASLSGMAVGDTDVQAGVGLGRECAAIKVECDLDLGLVGVASKGGPAGRGLFGAHFV